MLPGYGFILYCKHKDDKRFHALSWINWFTSYDEAVERKIILEKTWSQYGYKYKIKDCSTGKYIG